MAGQWKSTLMNWFLTFVVFAVIGWIYEVCIVWFEMKQGFVNRGFLYGPWLPLYGCGGLLVVLLFGWLRRKKLRLWKIPVSPALCFLAICVLATVVELAASYIAERVTGYMLWNYEVAGYGLNYQGRISLRSSLQFGVIGTVVLYAVYPPVTAGFRRLHERHKVLYWTVSFVLVALFVWDLVYHLIHGSNATW